MPRSANCSLVREASWGLQEQQREGLLLSCTACLKIHLYVVACAPTCYFTVIFRKTSGAERGFMNLSPKYSGARRTDGHVAEITEDTLVVTVNTGGGAGH